MNDRERDKYIHLSPVDPEPDGIVDTFAVPDTRLVPGTPKVYLDGVLLALPEFDPEAPLPSSDWEGEDGGGSGEDNGGGSGSDAFTLRRRVYDTIAVGGGVVPRGTPLPEQYILLEPGRFIIAPPDSGQKLRVSYYFQWFTDDELEEFLNVTALLLGYDAVTDASLSPRIRTPSLSFAAHYAYLKLAANAAQSLEAGAGGFTADNTREHPNWMAMAELAWKDATAELAVAKESPIAGPKMRFVNFKLPRYVPRS